MDANAALKELPRPDTRRKSPPSYCDGLELIPESLFAVELQELLRLPPLAAQSRHSRQRPPKGFERARNSAFDRPRLPNTHSGPAALKPRRVTRHSEGNIAPPLSPIDALASIAAQATHPSFLNGQNSVFVAENPTIARNYASGRPNISRESAEYGSHPDERPAKRARSEMLVSPQSYPIQNSSGQTRPATSYSASFGWSHNVEQSISNGQRLGASYPFHEGAQNDSDTRMNDAELLLGFARSVKFSAKKEPGAIESCGAEAANASLKTGQCLPPYPYGGRDLDTYMKNVSPVSNPGVSSIHQSASSIDRYYAGYTNGVTKHESEAAKALDDQSGLNSMRARGTAKQSDRGCVVADIAPTSEGDLAATKEPSDQGRKEGDPPTSESTPQMNSAGETNHERKASLSVHAQVGPLSQHLHLQHQETPQATTQSSLEIADAQIIGPVDQQGASTDSTTARSQIVTTPGMSKKKPQQIDETTKCAGCAWSPNSFAAGDYVDWLQCNGCKQWFHLACAGFTLRDVRKIDKFYCRECQTNFGKTTCKPRFSKVFFSVDRACSCAKIFPSAHLG